MIILDLLPKTEKKFLRTRKSYAIAKKTAYMSLIIVGSMSIILIVSKYIIQNDFEHITKQKNTIIESNKGLNSEIKKYNGDLKKLSEIQNKNKNFSDIIITISDLIPEGIILNNLSLIQEENNVLAVKIKGVSESRDILVNFKEKLNSKDFLKKVELPLSSLLTQFNIEFEISTKLYLEKMAEN